MAIGWGSFAPARNSEDCDSGRSRPQAVAQTASAPSFAARRRTAGSPVSERERCGRCTRGERTRARRVSPSSASSRAARGSARRVLGAPRAWRVNRSYPRYRQDARILEHLVRLPPAIRSCPRVDLRLADCHRLRASRRDVAINLAVGSSDDDPVEKPRGRGPASPPAALTACQSESFRYFGRAISPPGGRRSARGRPCALPAPAGRRALAG